MSHHRDLPLAIFCDKLGSVMQNQQIIDRIGRVEEELKEIKRLLKKSLPAYGSDAWWEREENEADKAIKKGRLHKVASVNELIRKLG